MDSSAAQQLWSGLLLLNLSVVLHHSKWDKNSLVGLSFMSPICTQVIHLLNFSRQGLNTSNVGEIALCNVSNGKGSLS